MGQLADGGIPDDDTQRVELLAALERLTNAARAAQARATAVFDGSQRSAQAARGVPASRRGRGIAGQVALARQVSPHRGQQLHQLALILDRELPATADVFRRGLLSQHRAQIIARETAMLSAEHRALVDREVAGDVARLLGKGDRELAGDCARWATRLDPASVVARRRKAESERHVGLRPAPDTMSRLSALLPVAAGVAIYGALNSAADAARAQGDSRGRGQVMADTLVARILGTQQPSSDTARRTPSPRTPALGTPSWSSCDVNNGPMSNRHGPDQPTTTTGSPASGQQASSPNGNPSSPSGNPGSVDLPDTVGVMLTVVLTDAQLLAGADGSAWLDGFGPIDAELARELAHHHRAWLRRGYADPATGSLVGLESRSRIFPSGLRSLVRLRDGICRTPWCDAPVRHIDHVVAYDADGPTAFHNGQGLCENCDYTKQAPDWRAEPVPVVPPDVSVGRPHDVVTTTPTGHRYRSPLPSRVTPAGATDTETSSTRPTVVVMEFHRPAFPLEVDFAA